MKLSMLPKLMMSERKDSWRCDFVPGCDFKIWQAGTEFAFTTDAVFLGNFPHVVHKAKALELGCGTGAISMLLASRGAAQVTALDCNKEVIKLLTQSVQDNHLEDTIKVLEGDLRNYKSLFKTESMDLVAANPPYRNSGNQRVIGTAACHEVTATLEDFFKAAAYAVRYRGRFALVQLPERFVECMELAAKYGLQPKRLQWVHSKIDRPAWIFLMEMVKGGSYGLEVLPPLVMYEQDGSYTQAVQNFYQQNK